MDSANREYPTSQAPDVKYLEKVERRPDMIPNVRHPEKGMAAGQDSGCETSGEGGMAEVRIPDVRHQEKGMAAGQDSGYETSGEGNGAWGRIPDVRHPEKVERRPDRILPRVE
uniref:Uncharacterized protein n=1 Tax=Vitis vinifera TaxID=29760 RepID=A5C8D8_VITVI|nr:hypothetical protein VITISV_010050 [Vitis vinifera]